MAYVSNTKKRRPRKQSSARVSTLAGRYMRLAQSITDLDSKRGVVMIPASHLMTLCASVLSQDETKGQGRRRRG